MFRILLWWANGKLVDLPERHCAQKLALLVLCWLLAGAMGTTWGIVWAIRFFTTGSLQASSILLPVVTLLVCFFLPMQPMLAQDSYLRQLADEHTKNQTSKVPLPEVSTTNAS